MPGHSGMASHVVSEQHGHVMFANSMRALAFRGNAANTLVGTHLEKGAKHQTHPRRKVHAPTDLEDLTQAVGAMQAIGGSREPSLVPQPYAVIRHGDTYRFDSDQ